MFWTGCGAGCGAGGIVAGIVGGIVGGIVWSKITGAGAGGKNDSGWRKSGIGVLVAGGVA